MIDKLKSLVSKVNEKSLALGVAMMMPLMAHADYTTAVTEIKAEFDKGETAVSSVMAATIEIFVIRRVWRIIRSSI